MLNIIKIIIIILYYRSSIIRYRIISFIFPETTSRNRMEIFFFRVAKRGGKRDDSRGGSTTSQRVHGWLLTVPVEN